MGKLYIAGIGPGNRENMTVACLECVEKVDVVVGYTGYLALLRPLFPEKEFYETPMLQEKNRCLMAIELAESGKTVCVVSSGDSGVYGMAGLIIELVGETASIEIEVIPGVTAALSGAALLGSPIGNDFAVISLSDLLTPWETIEKRLHAAGAGDFAICLYNPGSKKRIEQFGVACDILLEYFPEDRLCGVVHNIGRENQHSYLTTLGKLRDIKVDMTTTVFIGDSRIKKIGDRMVAPRGYRGV